MERKRSQSSSVQLFCNWRLPANVITSISRRWAVNGDESAERDGVFVLLDGSARIRSIWEYDSTNTRRRTPPPVSATPSDGSAEGGDPSQKQVISVVVF
ncbi:unnamed protein product [Caenorhabditis auriculariae]|uniref:Uncharacterized protein n=1 Tax=Caenorhabditis auriculariae TaxID=2777116 RepID=A0A8S1H7A0_9PELO|nr:unnamed protein product [Caenorhabditis auriculariae]